MEPFSINVVKIEPTFSQVAIMDCSEEEPYDGVIHQRDYGKLSADVKPDKPLLRWRLAEGEEQAFEVNAAEFPAVSSCFIRSIIEQHFRPKKFLMYRGFIGEISIYLPSQETPTQQYEVFDKFDIRVVRRILSEHGLLIAYRGKTYKLLSPLSQIPNLNSDCISKVSIDRSVKKFHQLSELERSRADEIYCFLNRRLSASLGITPPYYKPQNKYKNFHEQVNKFFSRFLQNSRINGLNIDSQGMLSVQSSSISSVSAKGNLLSFMHDQNSFNVYTGLSQFGPAEGPKILNVKYFFIFHKDDRDIANKLYEYLCKGYRQFPGLKQFVGVSFDSTMIDKNLSIQFTAENVIDDVKSHIEKDAARFKGMNCFAFYISRIKKDEIDEDKFQVYYKIKALLLEHNILSQVIYKENILSPNFNFFLPNIAVALLAKLGGKPWRIAFPVHSDLVIGIAATRKDGKTYLGSTIVFNNDGTFEEFDAYEENSLGQLGTTLSDALVRYAQLNKACKRVVIHYYKKLSRKEETEIIQSLTKVRLPVPFVVVTISDSKSEDIVLFDEAYAGIMPKSGTYLQLSHNEYILCNNQRYDRSTPTKIRDFPFPIRLFFNKSQGVLTLSEAAKEEIIEQVYQFSRIYWRSVTQTGEPVTIKYSELVALMMAHFNPEKLPESTVSKKALWFL